MAEGKPKYATALGSGNSAQSWRNELFKGGVLLDVESQEVVAAALPVPHSPRLVDGRLLVLLSATGALAEVDLQNGTHTVIAKLPGFVRGLERYGDYLFVGLSKLRPGSSLFEKAPIARESLHCGISVIYMPTGKQVAYLVYQSTVEELYDIAILPDQQRANILNTDKNYHTLAVVTPQEVFWRKPEQQD